MSYLLVRARRGAGRFWAFLIFFGTCRDLAVDESLWPSLMPSLSSSLLARMRNSRLPTLATRSLMRCTSSIVRSRPRPSFLLSVSIFLRIDAADSP